MNYDEIRTTFLNFFKNKNHKIVKSAPLVTNDKSVLFTVAGMVPWKKILTGEEKPFSKRVADVQKCLRAGGKHNDLEDVGIDGRHHTFFEMMGNWSFGDYFKEEAIYMSWNLIKSLFDINKIYVTTHTTDNEATMFWKKIAGKEAIRLGDKDNWWSEGDVGPCGPCTEIFYDLGEDIKNKDDRFVEIWNNVFMQYNKLSTGELISLPQKNVDTGAGLERWACVLQNKKDNYDTDLFCNLMTGLEDILQVKMNEKNRISFKIITDHIRAICFSLADGVIPSNTDRGYVIRRILRRAMRHINLLGGENNNCLSQLYLILAKEMGKTYPELLENKQKIIQTINNEEASFKTMLINGLKTLKDYKKNMITNVFDGNLAFKLYDTYGFPLDLTENILKEENITVDTDSFYKAMNIQKERSKADNKGTKVLWDSIKLPQTNDSYKYNPSILIDSKIIKILSNNIFINTLKKGETGEIVLDKTNFYATQGGQVGDIGFFTINNTNIFKVTDTFRINDIVIHKGEALSDITLNQIITPQIDIKLRNQIAKAHTGTHLLHSALMKILKQKIDQRGSKVSPNSIRFDFSFNRPLTDIEKNDIENLINEWINQKYEVKTQIMPLNDAIKSGAIALFSDKYKENVRVVKIGNDISKELCGGTHVSNTKEIIKARIIKEKSISSGTRRITMAVGEID